jgi:hypothetical protein
MVICDNRGALHHSCTHDPDSLLDIPCVTLLGDEPIR